MMNLGDSNPNDNYTIRKYRALKECPQGQQPGEVFEATEDAGNVLVAVGAAEPLIDDDTPKDDDAARGRVTTRQQNGKQPGAYQRRDMRAKE